MREPSEEVARRVQAEISFQERLKTEAAKMATALIQGYIGADHKVLSIRRWRRLFVKRGNKVQLDR